MLYLVTGLTQTGKTFNTVQWVLEHSRRSGRPVCHNGRFVAPQGSDLTGWSRVDVQDWQAQRDGTLFFLDACHHDFPARRPGQDVPEYIRALVQHDKRGMDFYLVTQYPGSVDSFVLDQVRSPGWHRHLQRTSRADSIRCLEWGQANLLCARDESAIGALVTTISFAEAQRPTPRKPHKPRTLPKAVAPPQARAQTAPKPRPNRAPPPPEAAQHNKDKTSSAATTTAAAALLRLAWAGGKHLGRGAVLAAKLLGRGVVLAAKLLANVASGCARLLRAARRTGASKQAPQDDGLAGIRPAMHSFNENGGASSRRFAPWMLLLLVLGIGSAVLGYRLWFAEQGSITGLGALLPSLPTTSPPPAKPGTPATAKPDTDASSSWRDWIPFVGDGAPPLPGGSGTNQRGGEQALSCVSKDNRCSCYNPQGTKVNVSQAACYEIVNREGN